MKIKSRVNGLIVEATQFTSEILKLGNGAYAQAISDSDAEKPVTKKTKAKAKEPDIDVEKVRAEAKAKGIKLTDAQIKGGNVHDDTTTEDAVETL